MQWAFFFPPLLLTSVALSDSLGSGSGFGRGKLILAKEQSKAELGTLRASQPSPSSWSPPTSTTQPGPDFTTTEPPPLLISSPPSSGQVSKTRAWEMPQAEAIPGRTLHTACSLPAGVKHCWLLTILSTYYAPRHKWQTVPSMTSSRLWSMDIRLQSNKSQLLNNFKLGAVVDKSSGGSLSCTVAERSWRKNTENQIPRGHGKRLT